MQRFSAFRFPLLSAASTRCVSFGRALLFTERFLPSVCLEGRLCLRSRSCRWCVARCFSGFVFLFFVHLRVAFIRGTVSQLLLCAVACFFHSLDPLAFSPYWEEIFRRCFYQYHLLALSSRRWVRVLLRSSFLGTLSRDGHGDDQNMGGGHSRRGRGGGRGGRGTLSRQNSASRKHRVRKV